jgi:hypothetical protein
MFSSHTKPNSLLCPHRDSIHYSVKEHVGAEAPVSLERSQEAKHPESAQL